MKSSRATNRRQRMAVIAILCICFLVLINISPTLRINIPIKLTVVPLINSLALNTNFKPNQFSMDRTYDVSLDRIVINQSQRVDNGLEQVQYTLRNTTIRNVQVDAFTLSEKSSFCFRPRYNYSHAKTLSEDKATKIYNKLLVPKNKFTHKQVACDSWLEGDILKPAQNNSSRPPLTWTVNDISSASHSRVTIKNVKPVFKVCDKILAIIEIRNQKNEPKKYGGDYIRTKIVSEQFNAAAAADYLVDNLNGTYSAYFTLRWEGMVKVEVTLVHSSEAVGVIERIRRDQPSRYAFGGEYEKKTGGKTTKEAVTCQIFEMKNACDFSNRTVGASWFCERPKSGLNCSDLVWHSSKKEKARNRAYGLLSEKEKTALKLVKKSFVYDLGRVDHSATATDISVPYCCLNSVPADYTATGYFHGNVWYPNSCKVHSFDVEDTLYCLQNKTFYFYGDSTIRQHFTFLSNRLSTFWTEKCVDEKIGAGLIGPFYLKDSRRNCTLHFSHHGVPRLTSKRLKINELNFIVDMLDSVDGGRDSVVFLSVWAHFVSSHVRYFEERIDAILDAVERLWKRSPETLVVFRGANTREHSDVVYSVWNSDYGARTLDIILRNKLQRIKNLNFGYFDVWELSDVYHKPDILHVDEEIIGNLMNRYLSYICPPFQ